MATAWRRVVREAHVTGFLVLFASGVGRWCIVIASEHALETGHLGSKPTLGAVCSETFLEGQEGGGREGGAWQAAGGEGVGGGLGETLPKKIEEGEGGGGALAGGGRFLILEGREGGRLPQNL